MRPKAFFLYMLDTRFWKKYFAVYDCLNYLIPYQELLDVLRKKLEIKSGDKILDAGAGTGNLAILLVKDSGVVIGLDSSHEGLEIFKKKLPQSEVVEASLETSLPFPSDYFDKIVSNNTIYTLNPEIRQKVFNEFYRVIKPGGIIAISNVHVNFNPLSIYLEHVKKSLRILGLVKTISAIISLAIPTLKIFYYNGQIQREHSKGTFKFMKKNEQAEYLKKSGFKHVSENTYTYANQAILNSAVK